MLRKYLCEGSRAAKVGQGHGSIMDLPSPLTTCCGRPTVNTDLYSREPRGSQSMLNNRRFYFLPLQNTAGFVAEAEKMFSKTETDFFFKDMDAAQRQNKHLSFLGKG